MKKYLLILSLIALLGFSSFAYAGEKVEITNGLTITTGEAGIRAYKDINHFIDYTLSSNTPIFSDSGTTTPIAVDVTPYADKRMVQVNISEFTTGTVTVRILGKTKSMNTWAQNFSKSFGTNTALNDDYGLNVAEFYRDFSISADISGTGTAKINISSQHIYKRK